ncbi:membrane protein [Gordoniibacillus kamchatkensis]|uniref:histidine kinase n=1 Tax=Gordoniibacillus kamchatkensis TaxID=1590651 RepID=A0ABR5A787_9BACL|nr:histidine kinase [Paenibacillus sp. VKM B-2647]KIL36894.1 membrane protein [Paenibacillus sp. VKM B-2647]
MSIRTKLFAFLVTLVVLMNAVAFFIYQSSRTIQESYSLMTDRILLYKQIANMTEDNLRLLSNYLVNQSTSAYAAFFDRKQELEKLKEKLDVSSRSEQRAAAVRNFRNMITTFLDAEESVIGILYRTEAASYSQQFDEVEKTAGYIQEENQSLVDQELSFYQPLYQQMLVYTKHMNALGLGLLAVDLLLCVVFALWLSSSITKPIANLVQVAVQISRGNLDVEPPTAQMSDEIGILTRTFRHMLASLQELLEKKQEMMEKDRLVKELEIKALQSQINPHFLFNTLNVVSKLAMLEGAERTSDLTVSVSNLLRYNLRKLDTPVTLRDEVEHAQEYFAIQQARFRDRVAFETDIDESALELPIPCLTLQPILENAFVHGIEGMEEGARIKLTIRREGDTVVVAVADNGAGMDEETRQRLLEAQSGFADEAPRGQSTGLGTRNVYRRLQLFYGPGDLVTIQSEEGKGTTVTIRVPWSRAKEGR